MRAHDAYDELDGERSGTLRKILDYYDGSPRLYRYALGHRTEATDAMVLGLAFHSLTLEPDTFGDSYAIWDGARRYGKVWDAFVAEHEGKTILRAKDIAKAQRMSRAVREHPAAAALLDGVEVEFTTQWVDFATGIACKALSDAYDPKTRTLIELKSTTTISRQRLAAQVVRMGWDFQLAHHRAGCIANYRPVDQVCIIAVESGGIHDVRVYRIPIATDLVLGDIKRRRALALLAKCRAEDRWPGQSDDIEDLNLPPWADPDHGTDDENDMIIIEDEGAP
jgi:hypothetical protein